MSETEDQSEEDQNAMTLDDMKAEVDNKLKHQTGIVVFVVQLIVKLVPFVALYMVYG